MKRGGLYCKSGCRENRGARLSVSISRGHSWGMLPPPRGNWPVTHFGGLGQGFKVRGKTKRTPKELLDSIKLKKFHCRA